MLTVATWNIAHGRPDPAALAGAVASLGADVVALQEIDVGVPGTGGVDQPAEVARRSGLAHVFGEVSPFRGGRYGNALFARGELHDVEQVRLRAPRRRARRAALVATAVIGGRSLTIATAHLGLEHDEAIAQLAAVLDRLAPRPLPHVLLGDLNLRTEQVAPWLSGEGFAITTTGGPSFPRDRPRIRIDHVATRGCLLAGSAVVRLPTSDHRAVVATIELAPGQ